MVIIIIIVHRRIKEVVMRSSNIVNHQVVEMTTIVIITDLQIIKVAAHQDVKIRNLLKLTSIHIKYHVCILFSCFFQILWI